MAKRARSGRSRLDMRREAELAEQIAGEAGADSEVETDGDGDEDSPKAKKARKTASRTKKTVKKKAEAPRMRMVWGVFDNHNTQVATFPYSDKPSAEAKAQELNDKGTGTKIPYFLQPVKEEIKVESDD